MYGYRQSNENGLTTNLNSISSSLSSIDTIGIRNNTKASADNLITTRNHSVASTSLLWNGTKDERYSNMATIRNKTSRYTTSEIYYNGSRSLGSYCLNSEVALNFFLIPLILLTITRQVFDFLGQIWLQILINFFTIILIIVALFGNRQHRTSYLALYLLWALFNTVWNIIVVCIHTKLRDVGLSEEALSFRTGATSWWHLNGPGCLPYNISSIQPINILQPNVITGCRLDYHTIETGQAAVHSLLSLITSLICCCVLANIRRRNSSKTNHQSQKSDKLFRLNNLINNDRSKVNQDPLPNRTSRFGSSATASLRRAPNKTSSRSSQHSVSSMRSARRRNRQSTDGTTLITPRGSTSSNQRSQKYGSVSSRRSNKKERRSDISSLTYGNTGADKGSAGAKRRARLSSLSSVDYLPSYQPPHSSSANLLSSYGEISSIDSYNNHTSHRNTRNRQASIKSISKGNMNPTYTGSRSSVCSNNTNANNYDDLSYIYGNNSVKNSESLYGASNGVTANRHRQQIYQQQQGKTNSSVRKNYLRGRDQQQVATVPQKIHAETYQLDQIDTSHHNGNDTIAKSKLTNGSFHSFSVANQQQAPTTSKALSNDNNRLPEVNNNHLTSRYQQSDNNVTTKTMSVDNRYRTLDDSSNNAASGTNQSQQIYTNNQRNSRYPIYLNHKPNGNSETPI